MMREDTKEDRKGRADTWNVSGETGSEDRMKW